MDAGWTSQVLTADLGLSRWLRRRFWSPSFPNCTAQMCCGELSDWKMKLSDSGIQPQRETMNARFRACRLISPPTGYVGSADQEPGNCLAVNWNMMHDYAILPNLRGNRHETR